jgi:hypothetical protein
MGAIAATGRSYLRIFEFFQPGFESLELLARSGKDCFLHLELFARDEIELVQPILEHAAKTLFEVFTDGAQVIRYRLGELTGQVFY